MIAKGWGAATDRGRLRKVNEDRFIASPPVFVVADGMGGHAAGDLASQLAIDEFGSMAGVDHVTVSDTMLAVDRANETILAESSKDSARLGMGTTITGIVTVVAAGSEHWLVFNVGDSRVYRVMDGRIEQITTDHSEAEEMVAAGKITREASRQYHRRNVVTRSLGTDPAPTADSWVFPPELGDRFLVCSDGLTLELAESAIHELAANVDDPQDLADQLVARAVSAGGRDNVTVVVVDGERAASTDEPEVDTTPRPLVQENAI